MSIWVLTLLFLLTCASGYGLYRMPRRVAFWVGTGVGLLLIWGGVLFWRGGLHAVWRGVYWFALMVVPIGLLCLAGLFLAAGVSCRTRKKERGLPFFPIAGILAGLAPAVVLILLFAPLGTAWSGLLYSLVFLAGFVSVLFILFLISLLYFSVFPKDAFCVLADGIIEGEAGEPSTGTRTSRLKKALRGWKPEEVKWVLAGSEPPNPLRPPDAEGMRAYLTDQGVPEEAILLENGTDTILELLCYISDQPGWKEDWWTVLTDRCDVWAVVCAMEHLALQGDVVGTKEIRPCSVSRLTRGCVRFFFHWRRKWLICGTAWFLFFVASLMPIWR